MAIVRLAGGILWREGSRLAVIHRPRQADWSLPKGRLDEGETWEEAALREVTEETGCEARITSFAGAASYVQRRTPRLGNIPVVILSAATREWSGAHLEVEEVLSKPVDLEVLLGVVNQIFAPPPPPTPPPVPASRERL